MYFSIDSTPGASNFHFHFLLRKDFHYRIYMTLSIYCSVYDISYRHKGHLLIVSVIVR
jgi:hypothetical protein